jgi:hypothetical protein
MKRTIIAALALTAISTSTRADELREIVNCEMGQ